MPWFDASFAVEGELFAQEEIFRGKGSGCAQTAHEVTSTIAQQYEQRTDELSEVTNERMRRVIAKASLCSIGDRSCLLSRLGAVPSRAMRI